MKTILFVEDESALQKTFEDTLKEQGYSVIHALDGETGLRLAKEKNPDLVLLDLILPKMSGFEVLEELKQDKATKHIPVIILTNLEDMQNVQKAVDLGATTYLLKSSYRLEEIVSKVKQALGETPFSQ
ncbi:MAG: response regulator [Candidatus Wildermuthbacteria bacterium]|nr:response regulator [Candidatus Wildermuthbacteria bacterium]